MSRCMILAYILLVLIGKKKQKKFAVNFKEKGLENFRAYDSGVETSYCDNVVTNLWNEEISRINSILKFVFCKFPILSRVWQLFQRTQGMLISMHQQKLSAQENLLKDNKHLKKLLNTFHIDDTVRFGCVDAINIDSKLYAIHYLELLNTLSFLSTKIDFFKTRSMFEIGGGFGANVHLMLQNFKNIKKIIYLDIVPNLLVGTEYLKSIYGNSVYDYLATRTFDKIQFSKDDALEIYCIAPWQIEKLDVVIDYFHNAHSFVEMPDKVVKNYASYIEKILGKKGNIALVSYDKFNEDTTFNPVKLTQFFKSHLEMHEHPSLINLDRKNSYFIKNHAG